jgi:shikimate dehydrogenase
LDPTTTIAGVIGQPVRHSLSPAIHNAAYRACGLDWAYAAFEVAPPELASAIGAVRSLGLGGLSVTMPHKQASVAHLDALSGVASTLQMVNAIANEGGRLIGHNTDGDGLVAALTAELDSPVRGRKCAVLGAGGAARAVVEAFARHGAAEVHVINRTPARALEAVALAGPVGQASTAAVIPDMEVVVNATPVGMGNDVASPVPAELLRAGQVVVDTIYHPAETTLLREARGRGCRASNGVPMLVHVSALVFEIFTGVPAPIAEMRAAAGIGKG